MPGSSNLQSTLAARCSCSNITACDTQARAAEDVEPASRDEHWQAQPEDGCRVVIESDPPPGLASGRLSFTPEQAAACPEKVPGPYDFLRLDLVYDAKITADVQADCDTKPKHEEHQLANQQDSLCAAWMVNQVISCTESESLLASSPLLSKLARFSLQTFLDQSEAHKCMT